MKDSKEQKSFSELAEQGKKLLSGKGVLWMGVGGLVLLLLLNALSGLAKGSDSQKQTASSSGGDEIVLTNEEYEKQLEERLGRLIASVEGAGDVSVMVTLENSEEYVYAQAEKSSSDAQENDSDTTCKSSHATDYVLVDDGNGGAYALKETTIQPTVKGVAVVCSGAGDIAVVSRITELVSTVLGVPSNRICVTK